MRAERPPWHVPVHPDQDKVHFWVTLRHIFPRLARQGVMSCLFCGVVRPADPARISKCRGRVLVTLRAQA